jgi:ribosomal protein S18 acetylase RimI-like enzyme
MVVIRSGSLADAAQVAAVQREGWFAAYGGIIAREIIARVTAPDGGARVRQSFRTRPWQRMIVAVAETPGEPAQAPGEPAQAPGEPAQAPGEPAKPGVVGYASFGPEVDVLAPWPPPTTTAGAAGRVAELYALYVHPAWWSTGTGRALMDRVLARTSRAGYSDITLWVLKDNVRARRFYERAGFWPDGASNMLDGLGGVTEVRYRRTLPS